jgi:hypothetical protein
VRSALAAGGFNDLTFRFPGGFAGPGEPIIVRLNGSYGVPFATRGFRMRVLAALHPGSRRMSLQIGLILPLP